MAYVMLHETWMEKTSAGAFKPRSSELKAVDEAIKTYHQAKTSQNLRRIRIALHNWKMSKGYGDGSGPPPWYTSERNRNGMITLLDKQIHGYEADLAQSVLKDLAALPFYGIEALADQEGRDLIRQARAEALQSMFAGKKLVIRKTIILEAGKSFYSLFKKTRKAAEAVRTAASGGTTASMASAAAPAAQAGGSGFSAFMQPARKMIEGLIAEIISDLPIEVGQELMRTLSDMVPDFVGEAAAAVAPYVSVATSTVKTIKFTANAAKAEIKIHALEGHLVGVAVGDPAAAANAIIQLIERARNQDIAMAGLYAADAAVKGAALAADAAAFGAPAVSGIVTPIQGLITAMATLGIKIRAIARDTLERHRANKIMASAKEVRLDAGLFQTNPILGCYFIAASTHSDILNFLVEDIGEAGWMNDVETLMKNHVHPLRKAANGLIEKARFEIPGLASQQGALAMSTKAKLQRKLMRKLHLA